MFARIVLLGTQINRNVQISDERRVTQETAENDRLLDAVKKMKEANALETERLADEVSFRFPVVNGETGGFELALDYLDEVAKRVSPLSIDNIEEAYLNLIFSYLRTKGDLSALERVIGAMQAAFDLPEKEEIEQC